MNDEPPTGRRSERRPKILFWPLLILAVVMGLIIVVSGSVFWAPAMVLFQADEGFKHARKTVNAEELRQWALQETSKRSQTDDPHIPAAEIPDSIRKLYSSPPEEALANPEYAGTPAHVVIFWGGGFFHWVIEIGDTNYSRPYLSGNGEYPYNFEWTNGIYYSREAGWKLW
jgi:hypothetical protein